MVFPHFLIPNTDSRRSCNRKRTKVKTRLSSPLQTFYTESTRLQQRRSSISTQHLYPHSPAVALPSTLQSVASSPQSQFQTKMTPPPLSSALNLCPGKSNFTNYKSRRFVSRRSNVASQHPALVTTPEMDLREICEVMKSSWLWAGDSVKGDEGYPHGAGDSGVMEIEGD